MGGLWGYGDAERLFRTTIRLMERHGCQELQQLALHNLGECLLRSGKAEKAIVALEQSKNLAMSLNDYESEIMSLHSYALALDELGDTKAASNALTQCRERAKRRGIWSEYVSACLALANLAWKTRRMKLAESYYRQAMTYAKRHLCKEIIPMIAVNYSSLLRQKGHVRRALRMLERVMDDVGHEPDANIYYIEMAEIYEAAGEAEQAMAMWRSGMKHALVARDRDAYATCSLRLVELQLSVNDFTTAEEELRSLILQSNPNEEERVIALGQLLRVLVRKDGAPDIQSEYNEFAQCSLCPRFHNHYIDVHLDMFEWLWRHRPADRLQAYQMYVHAEIALLRFAKEERWGDLLGHALWVFTTKPHVKNKDELNTLRRDIQRWIQEQVNSKFMVKLLIYPLVIAEELYDDLAKPMRLRKRLSQMAETYKIEGVQLLDLKLPTNDRHRERIICSG